MLAEISKDDIYDTLISVQNALFEIGAELSTPSYRSTVDADAVEFLETKLDELNDTLPPLKEFILPGGNRASAACDLARSVVRRAERRVEAYMFDAGGNAHINSYLNRLSDLLFVIGRKLRTTEVMWDHERR